MTLRQEMVRAARAGFRALGPAGELVHKFALSQEHPGGGFINRAGVPDVYYTVFGLALLECTAPAQDSGWRGRHLSFVGSRGTGEGLDFVHLCCLARCRAALNLCASAPQDSEALWGRILGYRAANGGFHPIVRSAHGTAYGAFLVVGAAEDLGMALPEPEGLLKSLKWLRGADGGWTNEHLPQHPARSLTNSTASAIAVLDRLGGEITERALVWLLEQAHSQGGFRAGPGAPLPDVLSTATALQAFKLASRRRGPGETSRRTDPVGLSSALKETCLEFLDSVWTNAGGFHGHWGDDFLDTEYTFYGLLALGHLSMQ